MIGRVLAAVWASAFAALARAMVIDSSGTGDLVAVKPQRMARYLPKHKCQPKKRKVLMFSDQGRSITALRVVWNARSVLHTQKRISSAHKKYTVSVQP